ncbi:aminodeoxychorismate synthase component I [Geomobilimonas luticola]|uniref:Aminodeoxychorismate synthase component I n=1 Tax=Geomobilimonas luticola TaxID=1114878 RepID=A0ABS5SBF1_9BACT|nr:aminodeoxychorismate synthase component I [Geomobilimonas luticola]MBT0652705.1 aminodeoxychorismate synthase component I [Geomobilimonas luticola]
MSTTPIVLLDSFATRHHPASYRFDGFVEEIVAHAPDEVIPALRRVEAAVAEGLHAAGFVSYEAAPGLGTGLTTHSPGPFPLVWFGIFRRRYGLAARQPCGVERAHHAGYGTADWTSSLGPEAYGGLVGRIREYIAAGDTYQVNFTLRQHFRLDGDPQECYHDLCRSQKASYCAFMDTERFQILSASPELFFELKRGVITCRPMKGTARRGRWLGEDEAVKEQLKESEKERAENLMIVDLLRNDMGKVAETGSVRVESLFDVETLETVHQMTSTITARVREDAGLVEIFQALFPCGSVTGAPKKRSMEIIRELEASPRGLYTGCIGYVSPSAGNATQNEAVFSVAIRTAVMDTPAGRAELGVGSGITIGSTAHAEYEECLDKGRFARHVIPEFQLVETMLHEEGKGYFLLERHLARLSRSADYFGFPLRLGQVALVLERRAAPLTGLTRVRLLLNRRGAFSIQTEALPLSAAEEPVPVAIAPMPVDSADPFLYHKTTHRHFYRSVLDRYPYCGDVLFVNERGEVTEGANHNVVARLDGELVTPPHTAGLLSGTFRAELLARGEIRERVITPVDLARAEELWLINSVRKWRRAKLQ